MNSQKSFIVTCLKINALFRNGRNYLFTFPDQALCFEDVVTAFNQQLVKAMSIEQKTTLRTKLIEERVRWCGTLTSDNNKIFAAANRLAKH